MLHTPWGGGEGVWTGVLSRALLFASRSGQLRPGWYLIGVTPKATGSTWNQLGTLVDRLIGQIEAKISQPTP